MHTNLSARSRKIFLFSMLGGIILILFSIGMSSPVAHAQEQGTPPPRAVEAVTVTAERQLISPYYIVETMTLPDGTLIEKQKVNGPPVPPAGFEEERQPVGLPKSDSSTEEAIGDPGSPAYILGCSSTAALDVARRQDNPYLPTFSGLTNAGLYSSIVSLAPGVYLPNLYTGPTNGGVMPGDNSLWPTWTDACGGIYSNNPLVASHKGVDGRTTRGTIDDYWVCYSSGLPDPYPQHPPETLGDYMLTSQSAYNDDGFTTFITYPGSSRPFTCDKSAIENLPDGSLGRRLFYESKGYAVAECYNQPTDNVVAGGFSLTQFKAEINAGRPVMLGLEGHNVVGIGYDTASSQIYIHDGWDYNTHSMPWGGSYAGLPLRMVSMVNALPPAHVGDYTISGYVGVPNATITYPGGSTKASITGYYNFSVAPGWSGRVTPSKPGYTFQPQFKDYANVPDYQTKQNYTATPVSGSNLLQDPSFELGSPNPYWTGTSTNFETPLCDKASSLCNGAIPRTGSIWGWFGGFAGNETATLSQPVTIPLGSSASLDFYLWIGDAGAGSNAADVFTAKVDGTTVFSANATQINAYSTYIPVSVDVSAYANGAQHTITFGSATTTQIVSFHLDDISLAITPPSSTYTISGSTGVAGATLNYQSGTAMADNNGNYAFTVPAGWSGIVTPSHPCYSFSSINRSYSNVLADKTAQNYTPTFNNASVCAVTTGVFRPSNGLLYLKNSNTTGFADIAINYGVGGDYPVVGDWDGNGDATIGIYRNGSFYLRNSNTVGFADWVFPFGQIGDQPIAGDWDGDGDDTIGVYRPSTGQFLLRNSNTPGNADISFYLGNVGDVGIAGDWNGDGKDTTGVFRPSNGVIFLKNINDTGFAEIALNYGLPGDRPIMGDWNNDGIDTIGIYRNGIFYLRNSNTVGFADIVFGLGIPGDMPIAGNWDGKP